MIRQQRLHHDFHLTEIMNPNRTITLHSYARNLEKNNDSQRIEEEYFTLVLLGRNCGQHYKLWVQESTEEVFNKIKSIY